jgi:hypothetical protein
LDQPWTQIQGFLLVAKILWGIGAVPDKDFGALLSGLRGFLYLLWIKIFYR